VVYGGDFNSAPPSDKNFTLDGAGIAAREANLADALTVAQTRIHPTYNSANEYATRPLHSGDDIDHLFTSPGVGVTMAEIEIDLRHGSFPGVIPSDHNPLVADLRFPY
jgi:endonuclease/exonuclease/phosphatase family metal-dependent hydrolase